MKYILFVFFLVGCVHRLEYKPDLGFLVSAIAESPEVPVMIDGYNCEDMSGRTGLCSLRIKSFRDLVFQFYPRQYPYRLHLVCSNKVGFEESYDVERDKDFHVTINHKKYDQLDSFICVGEIFPRDRPDKVSGKFEVRVKVITPQYTEREKMRLEKDGSEYFLVLGEHALYSRIYDNGKWKSYYKTVRLQVHDTDSLQAVSESHSFRVNKYPMR